jgi:hypothetical protein
VVSSDAAAATACVACHARGDIGGVLLRVSAEAVVDRRQWERAAAPGGGEGWGCVRCCAAERRVPTASACSLPRWIAAWSWALCWQAGRAADRRVGHVVETRVPAALGCFSSWRRSCVGATAARRLRRSGGPRVRSGVDGEPPQAGLRGRLGVGRV